MGSANWTTCFDWPLYGKMHGEVVCLIAGVKENAAIFEFFFDGSSPLF